LVCGGNTIVDNQVRCVIYAIFSADARICVLDSLSESGFGVERGISIDFGSSASEQDIDFLFIGGVLSVVL